MRLASDTARVRVPATSANLGPGFDAFGLALAIWDDVRVEVVADSHSRVEVTGEGEGALPSGEDHLIIRALRVALEYAGAPQAGLRLGCHNRIPHGRGLGSSAAATVAGLLLARGLISDPGALSDEAILTLAMEFEGHPDNAAPAICGGATIAYIDHGSAHAAKIPLAPLTPTIIVPTEELSTHQARGVLPSYVPHSDAAFTASRAGLLALALSGQTGLLLAATEDKLHQDYRAPVMTDTAHLVAQLRAAGVPAVVSGAGPSVLVLGELSEGALAVVPRGWRVLPVDIAHEGAHLLPG